MNPRQEDPVDVATADTRGVEGLQTFMLNITQGSSGAVLYSTGTGLDGGGGTPGAVPEPASWAMMIAGFGLVGAAARRRRNLAVAA